MQQRHVHDMDTQKEVQKCHALEVAMHTLLLKVVYEVYERITNAYGEAIDLPA
jgi:hypothetical protein